MNLLARIAFTTVADLDNVRSDFDDLPRGHVSAAKVGGMTRIVEGADDLVHPMIGSKSSGMMKSPGIPAMDAPTGHNPKCCPVAAGGPADARSPRQIDLMASLHDQLAELDAAVATEAVEYTTRMTLAGKWTVGRDGNASDWIGRMIKKVRELRAARDAAPVAPLPVVEGQLPTKNDKSGKPMPLRYAVDIEGTTKFYRIKPGKRYGFYFVDVQASDNLYPVRNVITKANIIKAIIAAGAEDCMARYGQLIGACGWCGITLTDETSRARGIGPDCWEKM